MENLVQIRTGIALVLRALCFLRPEQKKRPSDYETFMFCASNWSHEAWAADKALRKARGMPGLMDERELRGV